MMEGLFYLSCILSIILSFSKAFEIITWGWFWVLTPTWIFLAIFVWFSVMIIDDMIRDRRRKKR